MDAVRSLDERDLILEPKEATSVFLSTNEASGAAATLEEAGYPRLKRHEDGVLQQPNAVHPRFISMQVVKRNKALVLLVDGYVVPPGDVRLTRHTGLHRDSLSDGLVFSPCVVSHLVEDGQRATTNCVVSIEQTTKGALGFRGESVHLESKTIDHFKAADVVCPVVVVPYPTEVSRQPRVVIRNLGDVYKFDLRQLDKSIWTAGPVILGSLSPLIFAGSNFYRAAYPADAPKITELGRRLLGLLNLDPGLEQARAGFFNALNETAVVTFLGGFAFLLMTAGVPFLGGIPLAIQTAITSGDIPGIRALTMSAALSSIKSFFETPPRPTPSNVELSLKELSDTLLTLSRSMESHSAADMETLEDSSKFRREMLVWRWFLESETKTVADGVGLGDTIYNSNPMKFSEFETLGRTLSVTGITLRITAEDQEACDDDALEWDVECGRNDAHLLGLASSGILDDLATLRTSILKLASALDRSIAQSTMPNLRTWTYWYDSWFFGPILRFFGRRFRGFPKRQRRQSLESLGIQRRAILERVRASIDAKLVQPFFGTSSAIHTTENAVLDALSEQRFDSNPTARGVYAAPPAGDGGSGVVQDGARGVATIAGGAVGGADTGAGFLSTNDNSRNTNPIRLLPQRASSAISLMFASPQKVTNEFMDVTTTGNAGASIREFSSLHDARAELQGIISKSAIAVRNLLDTWESQYESRCRFVHVLEASDPLGAMFGPDSLPRTRLLPIVDAFALVLQQPFDVGVAAATASLTQRRQKQLEYVSKRHNSSTGTRNRTLFDALNIPNTESAFIAASMFAEFWADELVTLAASQSREGALITMAMQPASARALRRLEMCANFIRGTTKRTNVGFFQAGDVALAATQAGRDAKLVCARLHALFEFSPQMHHASKSNELTARVRSVSTEMRRMATIFSSKPPVTLPSEPLQSLFCDPRSGDRAVERMRLVLDNLDALSDESKAFVEAAVAASYASNLLGGSGEPVDVRLLSVGGVIPPAATEALRSIFVDRAATLRLDVSIDDANASSVKDLTERLAGASTTSAQTPTDKTPKVFYVPHGYGDAPPPLTQPSMSSPMFGSVPVYTSRLAAALNLVVGALRGVAVFNAAVETAIAPTPVATVFDFVFWPCENSGVSEDLQLGPLEHPFFIRRTNGTVSVFGSRVPRLLDEGDDEGVQLPSLPTLPVFGPTPEPPADAPAIPMVQTKAESFKFNKKSLDLSSVISSIAWNAERVLQASCLAGAAKEDGAPLFVAFDFTTRSYTPPRPAAIRSMRSLLQIQARARAFARNHVQRIRDILNGARDDLRRQLRPDDTQERNDDVEVEPAAPDGAAVEPPPPNGAVDTDDDDDDDDDGTAAPIGVNDAIFSFGVDFDGVDVDGVDPPATLEFAPGSATVLQKLMGTQRLTQGELDKWIENPRTFGEEVLKAFPTTQWDGVPPAMGQRQVTAFDEYVAANGPELIRLNELATAIESEKAQFGEGVVALRAAADDETEEAHLKMSRLGLAASSAIGMAMASTSMSAPDVDALFQLDAIRGLSSSSERNAAARVLSSVRDALANTDAVDALRLSEVCTLVATAMTDPSVGNEADDDEFTGNEYVTGSEEVVKAALLTRENYLEVPRPIDAQFTSMRAQVTYVGLSSGPAFDRPSFMGAPLERFRTIATARSSVELALQKAAFEFPAARFQPVVGLQRAATAIMTAGPLVVHRADASTLGRMAFASTAIGGIAVQPGFQARARSRSVANAAWFRSPSDWVIRLADGAASFAPSNLEVLVSLTTHAVHNAYATRTTAELSQFQSAAASLVLADQVSAADRALATGALSIVEYSELCLNFLDEPTRLLCDMLSKAGFTRAGGANRPVYALPAERTNAGEVVVRLPGELGDFVDQYRGQPQVVSNALCTLFNLPPGVQWEFDGDGATRRLEAPVQLRAFQDVRMFVMQNILTIAVVGGVSASLALASLLSSMYNVHPAAIMSTDDALGLASQQPGAANPTIGWLPPSITVNLEGGAPQFIVALGPLSATFGMGSPWDLIPSIQVQPFIPPEIVQAGAAADGAVLARQQNTFAEYPILSGLADTLVWLWIHSMN